MESKELPSAAGRFTRLPPAPDCRSRRGLEQIRRLRAILQTPCSFSATRRSCGVDRSIESFVSILLIIILAFPELQSNFPGRCDFWTKFVRRIVAVKQNKTIS